MRRGGASLSQSALLSVLLRHDTCVTLPVASKYAPYAQKSARAHFSKEREDRECFCVLFCVCIYIDLAALTNTNYTFPIYIYTLMIILVQRIQVWIRVRVSVYMYVCACDIACLYVSNDLCVRVSFYQVYNSRYLQDVSKVTSKNNQQGGYNITR